MSEFTFQIMEHCSPDSLIEKEQFFINTINPEYNVLKFAGNRKGFMHTEATKELQRVSRLGIKISEETRSKMSAASARSITTRVENKDTKQINQFTTIRGAAKFLDTSHSQLILYSKKGKLFRGKYAITFVSYM